MMRDWQLKAKLEIIRNKGACRTCHWRALKALDAIRGEIELDEWQAISTALAHAVADEGPAELFEVLKSVRTKYLL